MDVSKPQTIEVSKVKGIDNIMADITRRLYARLDLGKAIIVADQPISIHVLVKRRWARLTQKLQTQREESHETAVILDLTDEIIKMQSLGFTTVAPFDAPANSVFIMTPPSLEDILPECSTIFVISTVSDQVLHEAATCLTEDGIIVRYVGE